MTYEASCAERCTAEMASSWSSSLAGPGPTTRCRWWVTGSARLCVTALRVRAWDGDGELADSLEAALDPSHTPALTPLPVDLEELAMSLEGDPIHGGGRIDLQTGEVWPQAAVDYAQEMGGHDEADEDPDRWLWFDSVGSHDGYRDMEQFIAALDDQDIADRLAIAIDGRGAFRRFKDTLSRWPELMTRWHAFAEERQRGRARSWLADQGYTPTTPTATDT